MKKAFVLGWLAATLAGCTALPPEPAALAYRCDKGMAFKVSFANDTATLVTAQSREVLLRDAGGQGEQQTVYSNEGMKAEFGLGANAKEAAVQYASPPLAARCIRE